jgi:biopolymer transport protein ExbD
MAMSLGTKDYKSDINITPYIDILLVLLIIFMVATPMKKWDQQVRVPKPSPVQQPVKNESVVVELSLNHDITINTQPVTLADLPKTLSSIFNSRVDKNMFIRGDAGLNYGYVFQILDIAKQSGVQNIALLDKKPSAGAPAQTSTGGTEAAGYR